MKNVRHIIPLCDETLSTIRVTSYLFEKYWPGHEIDFLGFSEPDFELPKNHKFVSLAPVQEGGSKKWTRYIQKYVEKIEEDLVMFSLDDFFLGWQPDIQMLDDIINQMLHNELIGRYCLSYDAYINCSHTKIEEKSDYSIISIDKHALYRISTQPAIWRKNYLLKFLDHDWSPWNFEVDGSRMSALFDQIVLATADPTFKKVPTRWVNKGAVSRHCPGKVNVLGLSIDAIIDLLHNEFYLEKELQWGMWGGDYPVPQFYDVGGFSFHPRNMPRHDASPANWLEFYYVYENEDPAFSHKKRPLIVNLWDKNFSHTMTLSRPHGFISPNGEPMRRTKDIIYMPFFQKFDDHSGITIFTEQLFDEKFIDYVESRKKVGWIMEPPQIHESYEKNLENVIDKLDVVLTFDKKLVEKYKKCIMFPYSHIRIREEDCKIYEKSNLVSMVASKKTITDGHRFRHRIIDQLAKKHKIDLFGEGYNPFPTHGKIIAMKDYMYTIVVQNSRFDTLMTDLPDPLATGTIPIFWGTKETKNFFDENGIIHFETIEELDEILANISKSEYEKKEKSIRKNFEITMSNFKNVDDQLARILREIFYA